MGIFKESGSIAVENHPNDVIKPIDPIKRVLGIDVSHYEPRLDWIKARAAGVRYMYTKATEGTGHVDVLAKAHVADAKAAGVLTGLYHFFHASQDPEAQAEHFLAHYDSSCELPPSLDWEGSSGDGLSPDKQKSAARLWLAIVELKLKRIPVIYGGESHLREMDLDLAFKKYPLWLAHYQTTEAKLKIPKPWDRFNLWQYTDAEKVAGISGGHTVDANWFYGDESDLAAFCKT